MHDYEALLAYLAVRLRHVDDGFAKFELVQLNTIFVLQVVADLMGIQLGALFEG
jgi:hypothetical protein